jgi:hypothetical protein
MKRLEYDSLLKQLDNFQHIPGLSGEMWNEMISKLKNVHRDLCDSLHDSGADPNEFGTLAAGATLRKRKQLGENVMGGKKARGPETPEYPTYREPGAPKTKNKASGLPRVGTLPGSSDEEEEE